MSLDLNVLEERWRPVDGATVFDCDGRGCWPPERFSVIRPAKRARATRVEGARTTAALTASRFGPVLKVSEDGLISFFDGDHHWQI